MVNELGRIGSLKVSSTWLIGPETEPLGVAAVTRGPGVTTAAIDRPSMVTTSPLLPMYVSPRRSSPLVIVATYV